MKNPSHRRAHTVVFLRALLVLSLCGNVGFVVLVGRLKSQQNTVASRAAVSASSLSDGRGDPQIPPSVPAVRKLWDIYSKLDLAALRDRMRAEGFPLEVISATITHVLAQQIDPSDRRGLDRFKRPYWKSQYALNPKEQREFEERQKQFDQQITALLGPQWYLSDERRLEIGEYRYGSLSAEKIAGLQKIEADYRDLAMSQASGPSAAAKYELLRKEQRADVEKLLSPQELLEYDLRNSRAAGILRAQAKAISLTEDEFRALFPLYQSAERSNRLDSVKSPADAANALSSQKFRDDVVHTLGPQRAAEFFQAQDPANDKLNRIVQRLDLPLSVAIDVTSVRKDISTRADAIRADPTFSTDEKNAQLAALAAEAEERISGSLGARGMAAYRQYDGKWIQALASTKR